MSEFAQAPNSYSAQEQQPQFHEAVFNAALLPAAPPETRGSCWAFATRPR